MEVIIEKIYSFIQILIDAFLFIYENYKIITILTAILIVLVFISLFINNVSDAFENLKRFFSWIFKIFKFFFKGIWFVFKKIWSGLVWIFTTRKRLKYYKSLKESEFNVIPHDFKIPLRYLIFSHKVRKQKKNRLFDIEKAIRTKDYINENFKFITMIEAAVGGGKTSFLNGYSHVRTLLHQENADDEMYMIEKKIYYADFHYLKMMIVKSWEAKESEEETYQKCLKDNKIYYDFCGDYTDYVAEVNNFVYLRKYIVAYRAILRNNYVMSNYHMMNRITGTFNYEFNEKMFFIKEKDAQAKYFLPSYCTIVDDEKALSDELKSTSNAQNVDSTGIDRILRLFRQLKNETTFYISSTQNTSRTALLIRELANTYISIKKFEIVGEQNHLANIYRKKEARYERKMYKYAHRKFKNNPEAEDEFLNTNNKYKIKIYDYFQKQMELFAASFVKYTINLSSKLNDLQNPNNNPNIKELNCYFPLSWVYGVYRSCEYSDFDEFLQGLSNIKSEHDLKVISSLYEKSTEKFESMISEKEKKESSKKQQKRKQSKNN